MEGRSIQISHDGTKDGYLYEVQVATPDEDLRPRPGSTMAPGEEVLTTRELPVRLLEWLPLATSREQQYEEPLKAEDPGSERSKRHIRAR